GQAGSEGDLIVLHGAGEGEALGAIGIGRAAEDDVADIGPLCGGGEAEELAGAADDVILAEAADEHVGTAVAFDVIIAIGDHAVADAFEVADGKSRLIDLAVTKDKVAAELAE